MIIEMKFGKETMLLYAVTDRAWTGETTLYDQVECALKGGATCVQLREKSLCEEDFFVEAVRMKEICSAYGVPLIINDNISVALRSGADGVHVGQSDADVRKVRELAGDGFIIGASAHTAAQAADAEPSGRRLYRRRRGFSYRDKGRRKLYFYGRAEAYNGFGKNSGCGNRRNK